MKRFIFLALLRLANPVFGQENEVVEEKYELPRTVAKINPGSFLTRSLQADFEFLSDKKKMSLQFSPNGTIYQNSGDKAYGLGLNVAYRKYLREPITNKGKTQGAAYFYFSAGYNFYNTHYNQYTYDEVWNGSYYDVVETRTRHGEQIHKYSADIGFGVQYIIRKMISIDMNVGGGLRYADSNNGESWWDDWMGDYGHTGFVPKIGIAFGVVGNR